MRRRVVITGTGAITPLGHDVKASTNVIASKTVILSVSANPNYLLSASNSAFITIAGNSGRITGTQYASGAATLAWAASQHTSRSCRPLSGRCAWGLYEETRCLDRRRDSTESARVASVRRATRSLSSCDRARLSIPRSYGYKLRVEGFLAVAVVVRVRVELHPASVQPAY